MSSLITKPSVVYIPLANLGGLSKRFFLSHCVDDAMIDIQAVLWASLLATVKEIQIQQYATIFFCSGARYIYCTYASYFHYNVEVKNAHIL